MTLKTHFINSASCLYRLTSRPEAAIVSEKSTVFTFFPIEKPKLQNLILP